MVHRIHSVALYGMDGIPISVEADVRNGFPAFEMLGDLSGQVREAGGRVRSALHNSGYSLKPQRICINLSPANVRKEGNAFDLPVAVAILASLLPFSSEKLSRVMVAGELGLDGSVKRIPGILPMVCAAKEAGWEICVIPKENVKEASVLPGMQIVGVRSLQEAAEFLTVEKEREAEIRAAEAGEQEKGQEVETGAVKTRGAETGEQEKERKEKEGKEKEEIKEEKAKQGEKTYPAIRRNRNGRAGQEDVAEKRKKARETKILENEKLRNEASKNEGSEEAELLELDFADVAGQQSVKRAMEVAASGGHNLLLIGSAGSGKTMLARRIPGILPPMEPEEQLELSRLYSAAGLLNEKQYLVQERPFRSPHHSITRAAMAGGGRVPRAGEISLAHRGVLFLDELPEFHPETLELLRQPLEERRITLSRSYGSVTYPADFLLIAAMNPCRCGYYPDRSRCRCDEGQVRRYLNRISGPFLERIDLVASVEPVSWNAIARIGKATKFKDDAFYAGVADKRDSGDMYSGDMSGKKSSTAYVNRVNCMELAESSATIRRRVARAWQIQRERFAGEGIRLNSEMNRRQVECYCPLGREETRLLEEAFVRFGISARVYHKLLKIARTIADMEGSERITERHLSEAIHYRGAVKRFWEDP